MTIRGQIALAILAALNAGTPPVQTERSRGYEIPPTTPLAMSLRFYDEKIEVPHARSPVRKRTMIYAIECRAAAGVTTSPDEELEQLLEWVTAKLGGARLVAPNGGVWPAEEAEIKWGEVQGETRYGKATVYLPVTYSALVNDATRSS